MMAIAIQIIEKDDGSIALNLLAGNKARGKKKVVNL
jgi:hypothetical protein